MILVKIIGIATAFKNASLGMAREAVKYVLVKITGKCNGPQAVFRF
jgi:hypothetical protein